MIQRKQTLFLLLTAILCSLPMFMPLATIEMAAPADATLVVVQNDTATYDVWGMHFSAGQDEPFYYHGILAILATLLPLAAIFFYKKRMLQLRMCFVEGIFVVGLVVFEMIGLYRINSMIGGAPYVVDHSLVVVAPLIGVATIFIAYKGVMRDILLLASVDRIR